MLYIAFLLGILSLASFIWTIVGIVRSKSPFAENREDNVKDSKVLFIKRIALRGALTILLIISASYFGLLYLMGADYSISPLEFYEGEAQNIHSFIPTGSNDPYLVRLRTEYGLDDLVSEYETDFEKIKAVSAWVNSLWDHDGHNQPQKNDPISIIEEAKAGANFRCTEYAIVLGASLNALAIPARHLSLRTEDVETRKSGAGHVLVEAYLWDLEKWIMVDSQFDAIPVLDTIPLNAVELQRAILEDQRSIEVVSLSGSADGFVDRFMKQVFWLNWIKQYLYYFQVSIYGHEDSSGESYYALMLVPIGAREPTVFQRVWPISNVLYSNSVSEFYAKPILGTEL